MSEKKASHDRLSAIIGIRVTASWKEDAKEEARKRNKTLSDFLWSCLNMGWEKIVEGKDVKQNGKDV